MRCGLLALLAFVSLLSAQPALEPAAELVAAAKAQIGVTTLYDGAYKRISYPNGDVELSRGVCTDVLIRAYRKLNVDLQERVHEDMQKNWSEYPKIWGLKRPDSNIDHRRVPNLMIYFKRHGKSLAVSQDSSVYLPGDIVTWRLASGLPHVGLVADSKPGTGVPLVLHNIGAGVQLEDNLFAHKITGHFRYFP